jgi:hypothetical protein
MEVGGTEVFRIVIGILTGVLTYVAWRNGRWMKQSHQDTLTILNKIDQGQTEARKEMAEVFRKMDETFKKMDYTLKEIARLVVSEGERTRKAIKSQS